MHRLLNEDDAIQLLKTPDPAFREAAAVRCSDVFDGLAIHELVDKSKMAHGTDNRNRECHRHCRRWAPGTQKHDPDCTHPMRSDSVALLCSSN